MPTISFDERFHDLVAENESLIDGDVNTILSKWDSLRKLRSSEADIDQIHTFKLRSNSVDNCLWEGTPLFQRVELGLAFVPTSIKPSIPQRFPDAVVNRM